MIFRGREALPTHGGSKSNNGISGMPIVNKTVALSLTWTILSIILIFYGIHDCRRNYYNYSINCDKNYKCSYTKHDLIRNQPLTIISFNGTELVECEAVSIDSKGEFVDPARARRMNPKSANNEKFGYSVKFKVNMPVEEGSSIKVHKAFIFTPRDMGRSLSRSLSNKLTSYITKKNRNLNYSFWIGLSFFGALCVLFGFISLVVSFIFGVWEEKSPAKRLKKAS